MAQFIYYPATKLFNNIPTEKVNVEGADMLAGAGILNFLNIYVQ